MKRRSRPPKVVKPKGTEPVVPARSVNGAGTHAKPLEPRGAAVITNLFKAVAEPNRVRILFLIEHAEMSVGQIALAMETTRPALSRHLRVLRTCGLIADRRDGNRLFYAATGDGRNLVEVARHFL